MADVPPFSGHERRQHTRLPVGGHVETQIVDDAQVVTVRDVSTGGFLLESTQPFLRDAIHEFRVATKDGQWETRIRARSVHSKLREGSSPPTYLTGFAFIDPSGEEGEARVREMIDKVTSVVSY